MSIRGVAVRDSPPSHPPTLPPSLPPSLPPLSRTQLSPCQLRRVILFVFYNHHVYVGHLILGMFPF
jgi:hypothetical protein